MVKLIINIVLNLMANAVGLLAASILINDFSIDFVSFLVAVLIFTASMTVLGPFITKVAVKNANYLVGGIALVNTLVALIITNVFSDGISISGTTTWVSATVIVWIFSIIGSIVLPMLVFKSAAEKAKED